MMLAYLISFSFLATLRAWTVPSTACCSTRPFTSRTNPPFVLWAKEDPFDEPFDDDEETIDLAGQDWRDFRAKLVMGEDRTSVTVDDDLDGIGALFSGSTLQRLESMTPLDPSQWAYDSGKLIEQGAVILGGVEQEYGFGLRQQYFHKAAILVLDHQENTFTKGIILNRPTDLLLEDDVNPKVKWRVWFGGDVQGLDSNNPDIVCLHSLTDPAVTKASIPVMKDIQWTTFENAKKLVKAGIAKSTDFWVFCGYAGWGPGQLMGELDRKSWYMVATDSQTLLKELKRLSSGADPRDAGLETWDLLMNMIGRGETAQEYTGDFDDLMLKEWARMHLLSTEAGGGAGIKQRSPLGSSKWPGMGIEPLLNAIKGGQGKLEVPEGSLVRATLGPDERSPFLLDGQEFHKSVILIIANDENVSIGAILNRPAAKGVEIEIIEKKTGKSRKITLPLRFGGQYSIKGTEALLWLHCSPVLRKAGIGSPVGDQKNGIWKCTSNDVINAVGQNLASPEEFVVVSGVSVWTKNEVSRTMGAFQKGNFEVIPFEKVKDVWKALSKQEILTTSNLVGNLAIANEAWTLGSRIESEQKQNKNVPISGLGENFDEEDETLVFKSDVKVSELSDDALRSWVATFLLNEPSLGG